jgi:HSP20 family molecular chaperone IbpA
MAEKEPKPVKVDDSESSSDDEADKPKGEKTKAEFPYAILQKEKILVIIMDLPGLKEEDIEVTYNNDSKTVAITGKRGEQKSEGIIKEWFNNRFFGEFEQQIKLPEEVEIQKNRIHAIYQNGVFKVRSGPRSPLACAYVFDY